MRKLNTLLPFIIVGTLYASEDIDMQKIVIEEEINSITIKDFDSKELKSADLAEALSNKIPSISIIRRNFIANDIILRGQKRDNINIVVDGTKTYGACPNRMDPPISHVTTNMLDNIQIQEGPFDVENFGTLSGLVNITTKKPKDGFNSEINLGIGSFNYKKASILLSGGSKKIRGLLTFSKESSDQYKDGDGKNLYKQIPVMMSQYQPRYEDMSTFEKLSFMAKVFVDITKDQDLKFGYIANRSDNILYPSSKMDAIWDDSDVASFEYQIRNLSTYSKVFDLQFYHSEVDHPMSIKYRKSATSKGNITNHLTTQMQGLKLKNSFRVLNSNIVVGLDTSKREWDGSYYKDINGDYMRFASGDIKKSIDSITTTNRAIFVKTTSKVKNISFDGGLRYDDTTIKDDYNSLSANIVTTVNLDNGFRYFFGIGKSNRVPDARELYFSSMMAPNPTTFKGTPTLKQTTNYEVDFGFEKIYSRSMIKTEFFYSKLKDYIYLNASKMQNIFENIDAKIYGVEFSGAYLMADSLYIDYALAYKRGKKDTPLTGQSDIDLAEITPLKSNISLRYEHDSTLNMRVDISSAGSWKNYDRDNGEQRLNGYMVFNTRVQKEFKDAFTLTFGIDNILDKVYTTTNTYKDLTLITTGMSVDDVILLNEPGRYIYLNATYKF